MIRSDVHAHGSIQRHQPDPEPGVTMSSLTTATRAALTPDARTRQMGARLSALALILYGQGRATGDELSRKLAVNLRTIYRDVDRLQQFGLPIVAVPGPGGGFAFDYDAATGLSSSIDSRFLDLFESTGVLAHEDLHAATFDHVLTIAAGSLDADDLAALRGVRDRILIDNTEWYTNAGPPPHFDAVRDAVFRDQRLLISFTSRDTAALDERKLDPYGLIWKGGVWYLFAHDPQANRFKRMRLQRILQLHETGETFSRQAAFDLRTRWHDELEQFGKGATKVVLRIGAHAIGEFRTFNWKKDNKITKFDDHWIAEMMVDHYEWLIPLVLSYGGDVTILEPASLREAIVRSAQALQSNHLNTTSGPSDGQPSAGDIRARATIHRHVSDKRD